MQVTDFPLCAAGLLDLIVQSYHKTSQPDVQPDDLVIVPVT